MKIVKQQFLIVVLLINVSQLKAQTITPDLQDTGKWIIVNRSVENSNEDGKKAIRFNEAPNDGQMILKDLKFTNGTIEFDVKGRNVLQKSFVGIAFHVVDQKTYDAVYFRPFNFANPDTARRRRAVQYISMPDHPWEKLRETFPGKYENSVNPVPGADEWFHVKVVVEGKKVTAYINNSPTPSLQVLKLTDAAVGRIGLWVGNGSDGSFANLIITK